VEWLRARPILQGAPSILDDGHLRISSSIFVSRVRSLWLSASFAEESDPETFVFMGTVVGREGQGLISCRSITSSWRSTTAAVGGIGEILVGISRRTGEG